MQGVFLPECVATSSFWASRVVHVFRLAELVATGCTIGGYTYGHSDEMNPLVAAPLYCHISVREIDFAMMQHPLRR